MGNKHRKYFSSTGWETSYFGGFSQLLWDLPEMDIPSGFTINASKELKYLGYYSQKKLIALFLYRAVKLGYGSHLISKASVKFESVQNTYQGGENKTITYNFSKQQIKDALNAVIKNEEELKSMFIEYSNAISNSEISYKITLWADKNPDLNENFYAAQLGSLLTAALNDIDERKPFIPFWRISADGSNFENLKKAARVKLQNEAPTPLVYTKEETRAADKLLGFLDISFEKDVSKITSLKTGKIDIPKIAEVVAGNHMIHFRKELHDRTKPFSVCILNDESGSMSGEKSRMQHVVTKILYNTFSQILPPSKIFVYGHSGDNYPDIRVYNDKYNNRFESSYGTQSGNYYCQNYDGPVIDIVYDKVRAQTDENILFIVISDGYPNGNSYGGYNDIQDLKRVVERCKRDGFVTCGIGFQHDGVKDLYQYTTVVNDISKSPVLISGLINNVVKSEFQ
jgi:hypothetical protein